jgi:transposase-like protein
MAKGKYHEWLEPDGLLRLEAWARDGLTDKQIAHNIGVTEQTLNVWKKKYPSFSESLKRGKEIIDIEVENALLKRATGFIVILNKAKVLNDGQVIKYEEEQYYPPDPLSIFYWLKNRTNGKWQDKLYDNHMKDNDEAIKNWVDATSGEPEEGLFDDED